MYKLVLCWGAGRAYFCLLLSGICVVTVACRKIIEPAYLTAAGVDVQNSAVAAVLVLACRLAPLSMATASVASALTRPTHRNLVDPKFEDAVLSLAGRKGMRKRRAKECSRLCYCVLDICSKRERMRRAMLVEHRAPLQPFVRFNCKRRMEKTFAGLHFLYSCIALIGSSVSLTVALLYQDALSPIALEYGLTLQCSILGGAYLLLVIFLKRKINQAKRALSKDVVNPPGSPPPPTGNKRLMAAWREEMQLRREKLVPITKRLVRIEAVFLLFCTIHASHDFSVVLLPWIFRRINHLIEPAKYIILFPMATFWLIKTPALPRRSGGRYYQSELVSGEHVEAGKLDPDFDVEQGEAPKIAVSQSEGEEESMKENDQHIEIEDLDNLQEGEIVDEFTDELELRRIRERDRIMKSCRGFSAADVKQLRKLFEKHAGGGGSQRMEFEKFVKMIGRKVCPVPFLRRAFQMVGGG